MTPALQVVIIRYLLGVSTKVTTVWIVPSGSRCSILDFVLAVVVTLGRCERCWSGALSRNSHRGSINLWCPADKRPTDRLGAVTLGNIPEWLLAALGWIFAKRSLTHSWVRLSHKPPTAGSQSVGYHPMPLEIGCHAAVGGLCVNSPLLEWVEWCLTLKRFWGLGVYPINNFFFFFFTYFQIYIKSIENLYKIYRTDLLSRKFHLGDLCA